MSNRQMPSDSATLAKRLSTSLEAVADLLASAKDADAFLTARGLILRQTTAYKLPNALRMTVGTEEANRLVVAALKDFLAKPIR